MAFIDLTNVEIVEEVSEDAKVLVEENGEIKRTGMSSGGSTLHIIEVEYDGEAHDIRKIDGVLITDVDTVVDILKNYIKDDFLIRCFCNEDLYWECRGYVLYSVDLERILLRSFNNDFGIEFE